MDTHLNGPHRHSTDSGSNSGTSGGSTGSGSLSDGTFGSMRGFVYDSWRSGMGAGKKNDYISSIDDLPDAADIHKRINKNREEIKSLLTIVSSGGDSSIKERTIAECEGYLVRAYNLGMIFCVDAKGIFAPYGNLTRSQIAQIPYNMGWSYVGVLANY